MFFLHAPVQIGEFELPAHVWLDESCLPSRASLVSWHYHTTTIIFLMYNMSYHNVGEQIVEFWRYDLMQERIINEHIKFFTDWTRTRERFTIATTQVIWFGQAILDGDHSICARVLSFLLGCGPPTKSIAAP